jgi:hypothetical protein
MPIAARTRDQIRADYLAAEAARYAAAGRTLLTLPGSPAYRSADALATAVAVIEAQNASIGVEMLPSTTVAFLDAHAGVYGLSRRAATAATVALQVSGAAPGAVAIPVNSTLTTPDGLLYTAVEPSVTLGAGPPFLGAITAVCATPGTVGNKAPTTVLTWSSAPAGLNPTATVTAVPIAGTDLEDDTSLRARLLLFLRDRPGSGDRADWAAWVGSYAGVAGVYVYGLYDVTYGINTPGAVLVIPTGLAQGDSPNNSRLFGGASGAVLTAVQDYVDGTRDRTGAAILGGTQLRPATSAGRRIQAHEVPAAQDVSLVLTLAATTPYPWAGSFSVDASSTATSLVLVGDASPSGTNLAGLAARIPVATTVARGGFQVRRLPTGVLGGGKTTFNMDGMPGNGTPLGGIPTATFLVTASPPNDDAIRAAVFAYFDSLAPGDTVILGGPSRWPGTDLGAYDTLYRGTLGAAVIRGAPGVVNATVAVPATDITPGPRQIVTLGSLNLL